MIRDVRNVFISYVASQLASSRLCRPSDWSPLHQQANGGLH